MRTSKTHIIDDPDRFKQQLLGWAQQFEEISFLDSNSHPGKYNSYDCILAVDAFTSIKTDSQNAFEDFRNYRNANGDWMFGYFSYDLKNDTEALSSSNPNALQFPDLYFFQPKKLFLLKGSEIEVLYLRMCDDEMDTDFAEIRALQGYSATDVYEIPQIQQRISKDAYLTKVTEIKRRIQLGDIYEANFCMEFFAEKVQIDPLDRFIALNRLSSPPFAAFLKLRNHYALCASPERFLKKAGEQVISQPIKGTAPRYSNADLDLAAATALQNDPKERAENIMIVDLVRNDLSRTAQKGSVQVSELCEIYSFPQVHQMISTVESKLDSQYEITDLIKCAFPMGSMTGAPKISAMNIIEEQEESRRGLYSGALGYFSPENDFDLNVVIRSVLYNKAEQYLSFHVGSAITSLSDPELEYEECLLKAKAMLRVLS